MSNVVDMDIKVWKRFISTYVAPHWRSILIASTLMVISALTTGVSAHLIDPVVNKIFILKNAPRLWGICGVIVFVFLVKSVSVYLHRIIMTSVQIKVSSQISNNLFYTLLHLDEIHFKNLPTGKIITYFNSDVKNIKNALEAIVVNVAKEFLTILALVSVMFWKSWELSVVALFGFPMAFFPLIKLTKKLRKIAKLMQSSSEKMNVYLQNKFDGLKTVKAFCQEDAEVKKMKEIITDIVEIELKSSKIGFVASPLMEFVGGVAVALVILWGGYDVIHNRITAGSFFSFLTALLMLYKPIKSTSNLGMVIQGAYVSIARILEVMDCKNSSSIESPKTIKNESDVFQNPRIELKNVNFKYRGNKESNVINNLNILINPGEKVALVGQSGGGKSTIVKLLLRFYEPSSGIININDIDINSIPTTLLRQNISYVGQEAFLFDETVFYNLTYGISGYSDSDLEQAILLADAKEFISNLPGGLNAKVGHMGGNLSTGQKQRIIIARAILKNSPIVILDEATSALDNKTEKSIQNSLENLMRGKTSIVIAHRLPTVVTCDKIFIISDGTVIESGVHNELISDQDSHYHKLWHAHTSS